MTTNSNSNLVTATARSRFNDVRETAGSIGGALSEGSRAYVSGMLELGRTLSDFGREVLTEAGEHVRATFGAKSIREVAELQAGYVQHRIEMSATHTKEFVDLARARSEEVIAPLADLIQQKKSA